MISIKLFKVLANVRNPPLCSGVIAVPNGPKSHTFTVILAVFAPSQAGIINREKGYFIVPLLHHINLLNFFNALGLMQLIHDQHQPLPCIIYP